MKNLIYLFMMVTIVLSCSPDSYRDEQNEEFLTADAKANVTRDIVFSSTVEGTLQEQLASMVIVTSHNKPNNITWTVEPNKVFHVVILSESGAWNMQTYVSGSVGFQVGNFSNKDDNDPTTMEYNKQYYLYFPTEGVQVPFKAIK